MATLLRSGRYHSPAAEEKTRPLLLAVLSTFGVQYSMKRRRFFAVLKVSSAVLVLLSVGFAVWVRIEQYQFRWRAENLLSDIRSLEPGKSTRADAEEIARKWSSSAYCGSGDRCNFIIEKRNFSSRRSVRWSGTYPDSAIRSKLRAALAARLSFVQAEISVKDGDISQLSYVLWLEADREESEPSLLIGRAEVSSDSPAEDHWKPAKILAQRMGHPDYLVKKSKILANADTGGGTHYRSISIRFGPTVSRSDISKLMQFNFDCVNRMRACSEQEFMPAAWAQYVADQKLPVTP